MPKPKRSYTLRVTECQETGITGLVIVGQRNHIDGDTVVAGEPILIAHDIVEHVNGIAEVGSIADEFQALGAAWYTRGQFRDIRRDGTGDPGPVTDVAADIVRMVRLATYNEFGNLALSRLTDFEDDLADVVAEAREGIPGELDGYDDKLDIDAYLVQALRGMRTGITKQKRRYPCAMDANNEFWNIVDALKPVFLDIANGYSYAGAEFMLRKNRDGDWNCYEGTYNEEDY